MFCCCSCCCCKTQSHENQTYSICIGDAMWNICLLNILKRYAYVCICYTRPHAFPDLLISASAFLYCLFWIFIHIVLPLWMKILNKNSEMQSYALLVGGNANIYHWVIMRGVYHDSSADLLLLRLSISAQLGVAVSAVVTSLEKALGVTSHRPQKVLD